MTRPVTLVLRYTRFLQATSLRLLEDADAGDELSIVGRRDGKDKNKRTHIVS